MHVRVSVMCDMTTIAKQQKDLQGYLRPYVRLVLEATHLPTF